MKPLFMVIRWAAVLEVSSAFSVSSDTVEPRAFVELTKPNDSQIVISDRLPASFIRNWPTWVLEENGIISKIPDEESGKGFVTPSSIDELWQPIDLKRPDMKLAFGFHIRMGVIRHVMPALDISYGGTHRNRGINSVPRAHTWMDVEGNCLNNWKRFKMIASSKKQGECQTWEHLACCESDLLAKAVERVAICLAESASAEMREGSHILHVVLSDSKTVEAPISSHELRVTLIEDYVDGDENAARVNGILEVQVSATMSGSESAYLPEVYKSLYMDESLRNSRYAEFRKRRRRKEMT